jgi:predicted phage tail component-like protein
MGRENLMNGLSFNGIHCSEYGLVMRSKNRPILPEPKIVAEDIPHRDGELDYSAVNPDGRVKYKPVTFEINFAFVERSMANVRTKAHSIAAWLSCGEAQLSFDDDTGKYWMAKVVNKLDIENEMISLRNFTVQFKCHPYAFATSETTVTYEDIIAPVDKVINNPGTYVLPKITVTGSFSTLTLSCDGKTLTYSEALDESEIVIDNFHCIKDGNINKGNKLSGQFFEFANGNNTLSIGGTDLDIDVTVSFRAQYL